MRRRLPGADGNYPPFRLPERLEEMLRAKGIEPYAPGADPAPVLDPSPTRGEIDGR